MVLSDAVINIYMYVHTHSCLGKPTVIYQLESALNELAEAEDVIRDVARKH